VRADFHSAGGQTRGSLPVLHSALSWRVEIHFDIVHKTTTFTVPLSKGEKNLATFSQCSLIALPSTLSAPAAGQPSARLPPELQSARCPCSADRAGLSSRGSRLALSSGSRQPRQPLPDHSGYSSRDPECRGTTVHLRIKQNCLFYLPDSAMRSKETTFICNFPTARICQEKPTSMNVVYIQMDSDHPSCS